MTSQAPCTKCKLHLQRTNIVNGAGNWNKPKYMLIGEAPGREEDQAGTPFVGGAGKTLKGMLRDAGIHEGDCYFTNICRCRPPNNRAPDLNEIMACQDYLAAEIARVNPVNIIALGDTAAAALTGKVGITSWRGSIVQGIGPAINRQVLIALHPAYVMRVRNMIPVTVHDFGKLAHPWPDPEEQYILDPPREAMQQWFKTWQDTPLIACDIETREDKDEGNDKDALNPWRGTIIGISFCPKPGIAMALTNGPMLRNRDLVEDFLRKGKFAWANNLFDRTYLAVHLGIRPSNLWDVQDVIHLIHAALPKKLDFLRSIYTNIPPYKLVYKNARGKYRPGDLNQYDLGRLANLDTDVTLRVAQAQARYLDAKLVTQMCEESDIALDMKLRGILLDRNVIAKHYAAILPRIENLQQYFGSLGVYNANSSHQMKDLLYTRLKLPKHDDKGKRSYQKASTNEKAIQAIGRSLGLIYHGEDTDENIPEHFEGDHRHKEVLAKILEYRGLQKLASTYCEGPFRGIERDGRIHPEWKPNGTDTGRWSCKGIPVQGWPVDQRDMVVAPEGYKIIGGDYKGMQILGAAILAQDDELIQNMLDPSFDIHEDVRSSIEPYYPSIKRIQAKTVVFGTFFGRTTRDIAQQFGVPTSTAQLWKDIFYTKRPKLRDLFEDKLPAEWKANGYVTLPEGRKKYCDRVTEAKNAPVQNFEAMVAKRAMRKLYAAEFEIVIMQHDAVYCYLPEDKHYNERFKFFANAMATAAPDYLARFPCKPKQGNNWLEVS